MLKLTGDMSVLFIIEFQLHSCNNDGLKLKAMTDFMYKGLANALWGDFCPRLIIKYW